SEGITRRRDAILGRLLPRNIIKGSGVGKNGDRIDCCGGGGVAGKDSTPEGPR
ncbi:hypothetical protein KI387_044724, partial [Taxus chinensis]